MGKIFRWQNDWPTYERQVRKDRLALKIFALGTAIALVNAAFGFLIINAYQVDFWWLDYSQVNRITFWGIRVGIVLVVFALAFFPKRRVDLSLLENSSYDTDKTDHS